MSGFVLRARWVLPIESPPIEGGYVSVADDRIASVGVDKPASGAIEDLGDAIIAPGLVNAHTHLEFCDCDQPLGDPGIKLPDWIRLVIAHRKNSNRDVRAAIAAGLMESLHSGVTSVGDIATRSICHYDVRSMVSLSDRPGQQMAPALALMHEVIGFSEQRVDSAYDELLGRANAADQVQPAPAHTGFSPHAPYTVHPRLLRRIIDLASNRDAVVAMHLAESVEELQLLASGTGEFYELLDQRSMWDPNAIEVGARPIDYLRLLSQAPRAAVIHGNYLQLDEIQLLAKNHERMTIVYCPRTHRFFQHGRYPLRSLLNAKVRVAIGTDSRASNPDLNMLAELREAAWLHPDVDPVAILRMGTLDAAHAIGLDREAGSLSPGKRADMVAIPLRRAVNRPEEAALFSAVSPSSVWVAGRRVELQPAL